MLRFVDFLKQIVADVHISGGAVIERSKPSPDLLQRLREYALNQIAEGKTKNWVLMEWFTEGYFDEYIRVCSVHLQKIGVKDTGLIYRVLVKVIDQTISSESNESGHRSLETRALKNN